MRSFRVKQSFLLLFIFSATQFSELSHVQSLSVRTGNDTMVLDATTLSNLEIFRNQREGNRKATLWSVLDRTVTPAGGRLLGDWLRRRQELST